VAGDVLRETNAASLGEVVSPRSLVVKLCQIDKGRLKALAAVEPKDSDDHDQPASSSHPRTIFQPAGVTRQQVAKNL